MLYKQLIKALVAQLDRASGFGRQGQSKQHR